MSQEIGELILPEDVCYTDDHEWARRQGDSIEVGITDYAQSQLGDIVFVELPEVGRTLEKGEVFGTLESVKAVSEVYMPIGGEIVAVNEALADEPERVNRDPYRNGWLIVVRSADAKQFDRLKDQRAYLEMLKG
jgi:glycine cleavage system H protein